MKVVLVGVADHHASSALLLDGVRKFNLAYPGDQIEIFEMTVEDFKSRWDSHDIEANRVFVTIPEEPLYPRPCPTSAERVPCPPLSLAEEIVRADRGISVVLVCAPRVRLTALDVAAAMIMGVAAIVDCEHLTSEKVLEVVISREALDDEFRSMLVIGDSFRRLLRMKELISVGFSSDPKIDLHTWRACVALAQLDRLEPMIGVVQPFSYGHLADALNLEVRTTGFKMTHSDLRKALSAVACRFYGQNHQAALRMMMPLKVRDEGFPRDPPALLGVPSVELPGKLYKLLTKVKVRNTDASVSGQGGIMRIHQAAFGQLLRIS